MRGRRKRTPVSTTKSNPTSGSLAASWFALRVLGWTRQWGEGWDGDARLFTPCWWGHSNNPALASKEAGEWVHV